MKEIRIPLGSNEFKCLVNGGILTVTNKRIGVTATIILKDIGFDHMQDTMDEAEVHLENHYKNLYIEQ